MNEARRFEQRQHHECERVVVHREIEVRHVHPLGAPVERENDQAEERHQDEHHLREGGLEGVGDDRRVLVRARRGLLQLRVDALLERHLHLAGRHGAQDSEEEEAAEQVETDRRHRADAHAVEELARQRPRLEEQQLQRAEDLAVEVGELVEGLVQQFVHGGTKRDRALPAARAPRAGQLRAAIEARPPAFRCRFHRFAA